MTDRPEPVAEYHLCDHGNGFHHLYSGDNQVGCGKGRHTPLYPPSVVAGELKAMAEEYEKCANELAAPSNTDTRRIHRGAALREVAAEAARRAEKWEKK